MSDVFRELLKKVGSGVHTGKDLSRQEAATATEMILSQEATPAQIGAFSIAHRIKRPTSEELAGMLDAYDRIGPKLQPINRGLVTVLGTPYDGRSRTAPVTPITALLLVASGAPVVMHGGDCMPTKYGIPLIELWQGLGIDFSQFTLVQAQKFFEKTGLGFVYLPQHFPQAHQLVPYRDQIGKRPPLATAELIWSPYAGEAQIVAGYVHPPTEERFRTTLALRGNTQFTLVKGLEGSCDLPCDRTAIIAISDAEAEEGYERLLLHPRDYGFAAKEVPLSSTPELIAQMRGVVKGEALELTSAAIWNGGFYLWRCGVCSDLPSGFAEAEALLTKGRAAEKLKEMSDAIASLQFVQRS